MYTLVEKRLETNKTWRKQAYPSTFGGFPVEFFYFPRVPHFLYFVNIEVRICIEIRNLSVTIFKIVIECQRVKRKRKNDGKKLKRIGLRVTPNAFSHVSKPQNEFSIQSRFALDSVELRV